MTADLELLRALQRRDTEVLGLAQKLASIPKSRQEASQKLARAEEALAQAAQLVQDSHKLVDRRSLDLRSAEEVKTRLERQLMTLKSNDEYQAMQRQIHQRQEEISALETGVLEAMELVDQAKRNVEEKNAEVARVKALVNDEIAALEALLEKTKSAHAAALATRGAAAERVPAELRDRYDAALRRHGGLAMADVSGDGICQGCFMLVTPGRVTQALGGMLVTCNNCERFLFVGA